MIYMVNYIDQQVDLSHKDQVCVYIYGPIALQ